MQVDIYGDTVCPWCLIGRSRFRTAAAARKNLRVDVSWRTFQLNPEIGEEGVAWSNYLVAKFGTLAKGQRAYDRIAEAGRDVGFHFRFDKITCLPNSLYSHRLVQFAASLGCGELLLDALFDAYFTEGADIGATKILIGIGQAVGLPADTLTDFFQSDAFHDDVWAQDRRARRLGLEGVPTFLFDGRYAIAGAQDEEVFAAMFDLDVVNTLSA